MLEDLQEIILGKREESLTDEEINSLFCMTTTPEQILMLIKALNRKKIDPEKMLIESIVNAKVKNDLIPIALALRYGVDSNIYVPTCGVGNIHILGFVYVKLGSPAFNSTCRDKENLLLLNSIIMLLKAAGSNPLLPIFKCEEKKTLFSLIPGKDVITWLCESGYDSIFPCLDCNFSNVKDETATMISIFLDSIDLIKTCPKLNEIISAHSYSVLEKYVEDFDPNDGLKLSIKFLNLGSFEKFIEIGGTLKYYQVNEMLVRMKKYKESKDLISLSQLFNMLVYAIERGLLFDKYQLKYLEEIDMEFAQKIMEIYREPLWKKNCKVLKGVASIEMKKLAYELNLNPEYCKEILCDEISKIVSADIEEVKKSVITRQEKRVSATLCHYLSFINGEPKVIPRNRSLVTNMYDYPDNDIVFYKDVDNISWIFTRNMFVDLLENGKNPYTNQPLPQLLKEEMEKRNLYYINIFGISDDIVEISITLDNLNKEEKITNDITEKRIKKFFKLGQVDRDTFEKISTQEMSNILKDIVSNELDLKDLPKDFAFATFAITVEEHLRENPLLSIDFFANIRMHSKALIF
jgi:hypothetical protein